MGKQMSDRIRCETEQVIGDLLKTTSLTEKTTSILIYLIFSKCGIFLMTIKLEASKYKLFILRIAPYGQVPAIIHCEIKVIRADKIFPHSLLKNNSIDFICFAVILSNSKLDQISGSRFFVFVFAAYDVL